jgi:hypothetical protein
MIIYEFAIARPVEFAGSGRGRSGCISPPRRCRRRPRCFFVSAKLAMGACRRKARWRPFVGPRRRDRKLIDVGPEAVLFLILD